MPVMELNNIVKTDAAVSKNISKGTIVSEVFNAAVEVGRRSLSDFTPKQVEESMTYIKGLAGKALNNDTNAIMEINQLRTIAVEELIVQPIKILGVFGTFQKFGINETIIREVPGHAGEKSRVQAGAGDVVFAQPTKVQYPVPTVTISGGYEVNYRAMQLGDMSAEARGIKMVAVDIMNKAMRYVVDTINTSVMNATGVKYTAEVSGLTQTALDGVVAKIRRFGKTSIVADYMFLDQMSAFAGYKGAVGGTDITGISRTTMDQIHQIGHPTMYKGSVVAEMPNPYDLTTMNEDGTDYATVLPVGYAYVIPANGIANPVFTAIRGGLTSLQGVDVKSGTIQTRFDLEVAADVAKGREGFIGIIHDTNLDGLEA